MFLLRQMRFIAITVLACYAASSWSQGSDVPGPEKDPQDCGDGSIICPTEPAPPIERFDKPDENTSTALTLAPGRALRIRHSRHLDGFSPNVSPPSKPPGYELQLKKAAAAGKWSTTDNHKPIFKNCSNYHFTIKEEQKIGTYIMTLHAEDPDAPDQGGTVTYHVVSAPLEKPRVNVDPHTGVMTSADSYDHDEPSREKEFYVPVRATDNGNPSLDDTCTVHVSIEDINDNQPIFDKVAYSESVPQDLLVGGEVMRISATDIDDGNNSVVHYSLDNSPDAQYFVIDPDNGVIFLNKTIDKPTGYNFKMSAIVKDQGVTPMQSSINLNIQVIESNKKSPSFIEVPGSISLKENHGDFSTPIAVIKATSNIPNETYIQYELIAGQTDQTNKQHTFVLVPDSKDSTKAYIKLGRPMDYEKITDYTLTVRAQNGYRLATEYSFTVHVEDVNDNIPQFSDVRSGTVLENEPVGTMVMQVRAYDLDATAPHNQITYQLEDPNVPFAIDPISGNITTSKVFDREERSFWSIRVSARDGSNSSLVGLSGRPNIGYQNFIIDIADKNDNPPRFVKGTYLAEYVAENANVNELVTQVQAKDVDTASVITYSIVSGNEDNAFVIRNITGEIRVNKELDYEKIPIYTLDVLAFDGVYKDFAKVVIKIENLNDNPPIFVQNYTTTIEEEKLYEGCIIQVEAYDPDILDRNSPQNIVYSLVKEEQMEYLSIDNDGCMRLRKPLDRDQPTGLASWQVLVMAADQGGKSGVETLRSTTEVTIVLTDINDNAPFLTNTQPVIWYENQPPGLIVLLTANDYDAPENGPPFTFALNNTAHDSKVKESFYIQGNGLFASVSFDRETRKSYYIAISITDSGTPRLTGLSFLRIVIGDRNDNFMRPGSSSVFVYNFKGESPDIEIGRVYVEDQDDWDIGDKTFSWAPSFNERSPFFDVNRETGIITMHAGTPNGTYLLKFNVTEHAPPIISFHDVEAVVNVTVKEIPEEAVDRSGSIRFLNYTAEQFIVPEIDGTSKKEKLNHLLAMLFNVSTDNVDIFTVANKRTVKDQFLDVRFSAHGSPYYAAEKLNAMVNGIMDKLQDELGLRIYMVHIDECLIEREQCEDACHNVLVKNNAPLAVFTNTTSFIGISAHVEPVCGCDIEQPFVCLNGGTPFADKCECRPGFDGPHCEQTVISFRGDGWAMYPAPPSCHDLLLTFTLTSHTKNCLVMYGGPQRMNPLLPVEDFMALSLVDGYPSLLANLGSGTVQLNNTYANVADGEPHHIEINFSISSIELFVDRCKLTSCMSLTAPIAPKQILNLAGPLLLGGSNVKLAPLAKSFGWRFTPDDLPLIGCISNFSYNGIIYDLGRPSYDKNVESSCQLSMYTAVTFGIDTNFLIAIFVCIAILVILLLAVVVHRRRADAWAEKELDDIRENIIAYEDEGGGEGDAGYDLHVLRQMYDNPPPDTEGFMHSAGLGGAPDISGFLDNKKGAIDNDPDANNPYDDVRHYAYEGDGNSTGSLSSLASCTDDGDLKFNYLSTFGPRFRKLADMYGDSDDERPHEESWC